MTTWFYPFPAGSAYRPYEVARRLSRRHEVHIYTTEAREARPDEAMDSLRLHRYGVVDSSWSLEKGVVAANLWFSVNTLRRLLDPLARGFDLVECNITSKSLPFICYMFTKLRGIPLVETWHEVWTTYNFKQYNPALATAALVAEHAIPRLTHHLVAVSETTKARLIRLLKVSGEKVTVIPNGVDVEAFRRVGARKRRGRIIYVGRLESHKRVDLLLQAYSRLETAYPECELLILGNGSQRTHLMDLAEKLGLQRVSFLGVAPRGQLMAWMKSSTILVLPSILEGQGMVLLEAMAAGTPPVAVSSPGSGVSEVVRHGFNGLLVHPTVEDLREAIERLLTDEDLYGRLRRNGSRFVEEYDWDRVASRVDDLYRRLAG